MVGVKYYSTAKMCYFLWRRSLQQSYKCAVEIIEVPKISSIIPFFGMKLVCQIYRPPYKYHFSASETRSSSTSPVNDSTRQPIHVFIWYRNPHLQVSTCPVTVWLFGTHPRLDIFQVHLLPSPNVVTSIKEHESSHGISLCLPPLPCTC